jgi:hypothetical protein
LISGRLPLLSVLFPLDILQMFPYVLSSDFAWVSVTFAAGRAWQKAIAEETLSRLFTFEIPGWVDAFV